MDMIRKALDTKQSDKRHPLIDEYHRLTNEYYPILEEYSDNRCNDLDEKIKKLEKSISDINTKITDRKEELGKAISRKHLLKKALTTANLNKDCNKEYYDHRISTGDLICSRTSVPGQYKWRPKSNLGDPLVSVKGQHLESIGSRAIRQQEQNVGWDVYDGYYPKTAIKYNPTLARATDRFFQVAERARNIDDRGLPGPSFSERLAMKAIKEIDNENPTDIYDLIDRKDFRLKRGKYAYDDNNPYRPRHGFIVPDTKPYRDRFHGSPKEEKKAEKKLIHELGYQADSDSSSNTGYSTADGSQNSHYSSAEEPPVGQGGGNRRVRSNRKTRSNRRVKSNRKTRSNRRTRSTNRKTRSNRRTRS